MLSSGLKKALTNAIKEILRDVEAQRMATDHHQTLQTPLPEECPPEVSPDWAIDVGQYYDGDGCFARTPGSVHLNHDEIQHLKQKHRQNPVVAQAFDLVKGLDIANRQDIEKMCLFLQSQPRYQSVQKIRDVLSEDKIKLSTITNKKHTTFAGRDAIKQMIGNHGYLNKAKRLLGKYPELSRGLLPDSLDKFNNKDLASLKTALAYSCRNHGASEAFFKALNGFYQVDITHDYETKLSFGKHLYIPTCGYILTADQRQKNADGSVIAITDCSGFMTNIMRNVRPDITWLNHHRFNSWHATQFVDQALDAGPLKTNGKRRDYKTKGETRFLKKEPLAQHRLNAYKAAFEQVLHRKDIQPGDFIVYNNRKPYGHGYESSGGHVAMVLDYDANRPNKAVLLEYTRSGPRNGAGFTKGTICWDEENTIYETRILRPKLR